MSQTSDFSLRPATVLDADRCWQILQQGKAQITIVDAGLDIPLSDTSQYVFASEAANAGKILFSKTQLNPPDAPTKILSYLNESLTKINCKRQITSDEIMAKDWSTLTDDVGGN